MSGKTGERGIFPFGYKLMISYLLLVLTPVLAIGYYSYTSTVAAVRSNVQSSLSDALRQTRDSIMVKVNELQKASDQLFFDESLRQVITTRYDPQTSYDTTTQYLVPKVASASRLTEDRVNVSFYYDNDSLPEIYYDPKGDPLAKGRRYELFHLGRLAGKDWYSGLTGSDDPSAVWGQIETDAKYGNISYYRLLTDFRVGIPIGFIRVTAKLSDLFHSLDYHKIGQGSYLLVVDRDDHVLYQTAEPQASPPDWKKEQSDFLTIREELPGMNWSLVALVPYAELEESAGRVRNLTIAVCLISFAALTVISFFVSRYFSVRIKKIVASLNALQSGEFGRRIEYSGNDEFRLIVHAFNDMAQNIDGLIHEVYASNLQKKEAELTALQAQINPHFLYNTLSSISRLAQLDEKRKLHEMVMGLARFYRLTLNEGKTLISVGLELQQVKAYVDIQKIKYADRLEVSYDVDPDVLECETVKLILQPFVENALEHAWFGGTIHIRITAERMGANVVLKVIDNGIGMSRETVRQIFDPDGVRLGYGIRNADERIKLQFSDAYGVRIYSGRGIGTTVRIVIPTPPGGADGASGA